MMCAAALLSVLAPMSMASAQAVATYVFETVDSYDNNPPNSNDSMHITGIIRGESAPRTIGIRHEYDGYGLKRLEQCERMLLLSMTKPGQYLVEVRQESFYGNYLGCKLTRR
jgi:hypothetical protein